MGDFVIAGIGEVLFDCIGSSEELGGAPVNFAYHVNRLGATGVAISTIGDDVRGERALAELAIRELSTEYITVAKGYETGYVQAHLDDTGVATYHFPDDIAWDHLRVSQKAVSLASGLDAICFGSLVQRAAGSRAALMDYLDQTRTDTLKVFDLNLRQNFYSQEVVVESLGRADILKLNDDELPVLADMLQLSGDDRTLLSAIVEQYRLRLAALTKGGHGSLLVTPEAHSDHPGVRVERIVDTIGAGDAFTAATVISLLKGYDLDTINEKANRVAAWVCSEKGAMPKMPLGFRI